LQGMSPEYWAPLGVWVVRETARYALGFMAHKLKGPKAEMAAEIKAPARVVAAVEA